MVEEQTNAMAPMPAKRVSDITKLFRLDRKQAIAVLADVAFTADPNILHLRNLAELIDITEKNLHVQLNKYDAREDLIIEYERLQKEQRKVISIHRRRA